MKIESKIVKIRELVSGYKDSGGDGVVGFSGKLNIRPPYQREFVYGIAQRDKVLDTVLKGYPLNVMYWAKNFNSKNPNDDSLVTFEVLDGQQRTLSICKYIEGDFSISIGGNPFNFHNLREDQKKAILDYEITIYICDGPESEKLEWFKTINIAGEKLTEQELLNAVYTGPWLANAKSYFSKTNCVAQQISKEYVPGIPNRQELLEKALEWNNEGKTIVQYMADHQNDATAVALWNHFSNIINWVKATFTSTRKEMKSVDWGSLYAEYKDADLDPKELEVRVSELMEDEDVTKKSGIYNYVLSGEERHLSLRAFTDKIKRETFTKQGGVCANAKCKEAGKVFQMDEMEADHIDPWHAGGKSVSSNCQMLCKGCNRRKGGK